MSYQYEELTIIQQRLDTLINDHLKPYRAALEDAIKTAEGCPACSSIALLRFMCAEVIRTDDELFSEAIILPRYMSLAVGQVIANGTEVKKVMAPYCEGDPDADTVIKVSHLIHDIMRPTGFKHKTGGAAIASKVKQRLDRAVTWLTEAATHDAIRSSTRSGNSKGMLCSIYASGMAAIAKETMQAFLTCETMTEEQVIAVFYSSFFAALDDYMGAIPPVRDAIEIVREGLMAGCEKPPSVEEGESLGDAMARHYGDKDELAKAEADAAEFFKRFGWQ